jgi:ribosomal protein S18 acetylase RimI-like enzyme
VQFHLLTLEESHFERLHVLFDDVCREEKYLAFTQAGSREQTFGYYQGVLSAGHIHYVAVSGDQVIGWCDAVPSVGQMRAHIGTLGMAVALNARGCGVGMALITKVIEVSTSVGITRLELTVHSENLAALALYKKVGFVIESTQQGGWCLRGKYSDVYSMARVRI